jgi:hypothetical protein
MTWTNVRSPEKEPCVLARPFVAKRSFRARSVPSPSGLTKSALAIVALSVTTTTQGQERMARPVTKPQAAAGSVPAGTVPKVGVPASATPPAPQCDPVTLKLTAADMPALRAHSMGNKDLDDDEWTSVSYKVRLRTTPMRVYLYTHARLSEVHADHTLFEQTGSSVVYTERAKVAVAGTQPEEKCEITGLSVTTVPGFDHHGLVTGLVVGKAKKKNWTSLPSGVDNARAEGIVSSVECKTDYGEDDTGKVGCRNAVLREIQILRKPRREACGSVTVQPPRAFAFPFYHRSGDKEMDNGKHTIHVFGKAGDPLSAIFPRVIKDVGIWLDPKVELVQYSGDRTTFGHGAQGDVLLREDIPPHCDFGSATLQGYKAVWLSRPKEEDHDWTYMSAPADTPIVGVECRTDSKGEDDGKLGCWVFFRPVTVNLVRRP